MNFEFLKTGSKPVKYFKHGDHRSLEESCSANELSPPLKGTDSEHSSKSDQVLALTSVCYTDRSKYLQRYWPSENMLSRSPSLRKTMTTGRNTPRRKRVDMHKQKAKEITETVKERVSQAITSEKKTSRNGRRTIGQVIKKGIPNSKTQKWMSRSFKSIKF